MTLMEDAFFTTIAYSLPLPPDMIQRLQTMGKHIEQLQKAAACEEGRLWKIEAEIRKRSLCELLGASGQRLEQILRVVEELEENLLVLVTLVSDLQRPQRPQRSQR